MSREIDFSKPLSSDDAAYVSDRPWLAQDAELKGFDIIVDDDFRVEDEDEDGSGGSDESGEGGSGDESSDDADESEDDESEDDEETEETEEVDYEDLTVEALKDLLKGRDLPVSGSKEQLINRLEEADAAN